MALNDIFNKSIKLVKSNSPELLTALGVSGILTTTFLTHKAAVAAHEKLYYEGSKHWTKKEKALFVWKLYIPTAVSGTITIACVIGASKAKDKRTTAAVAAYSLTEKAFSEYKEKVVEQIGKGKEQKVRDDIAQDKVDKTSKSSKEVIVAGSGEVLCCELYTQRYFRSDMETLRKAQNDVNVKIVNELYVTLDEFYDILGLAHTTNSSKIGWNSDKLMDMYFSTVLSDSGVPCLAFEYNYIKPL